MAKAKNLLLAGLLALVSLFSIGLFAACGNEEDKGGNTDIVQPQTVALADVVATNGDVVELINKADVLNNGEFRNFKVHVLVNDNEVKTLEVKNGSDVKKALKDVEVSVKSGDTIVVNYIYNDYLFSGDFWGNGFFGDWMWSANDKDKTETQTFIVK